MEQINLPDPKLAGGAVSQVVVHQQSRCWDLTLHFPHVLPFPIYKELHDRLQMSFKQLAAADVKLRVKTDDQEADSKLVGDYWRYLANEEVGMSWMGFEIAEKTMPTEHEGRIELFLENEQVKEFVSRQFLGKLSKLTCRPAFRLSGSTLKLMKKQLKPNWRR